MSFDPFLDLVPPRLPSPPPPPVQPYAVELPDELLRHIFELAVVLNPHTEPQLMLVSKWVRAWVERAFYEIAFVRGHAHRRQLAARPDHLLAKTRNLWLDLRASQAERELLARMPGVTSLAIGLVTPHLHRLLPVAMRLRELDGLDVGSGVTVDLSPTAFDALTHLRLARLFSTTVAQLASSVLPALTHLAVDQSVTPTDCRRILHAPSRVGLHVLVLVFAGSDGHARALRALALPRLVIFLEEDWRLPGRDWLARARGESAFWERAAQQLHT